MLEHADRDDAVERALHVAIIDQLEFHMIGDACLLRALPRHGQLLLRQRDADDIDAAFLVQIERHAAPAATNVQHLHARLEMQFGRDMRFFVELRLVQPRAEVQPRIEVFGVIGPIGAAILLVPVEEQIVERARQIIMMGDVLPGGGAEIGLLQPPHRRLGQPSHQPGPLQALAAFPARIAAHQPDKTHDILIIDDKAPVHIGFGKAQPRVEHDIAPHFGIGEAHRHIREAGGGDAETTRPALRVHEGQRPFFNQPRQEMIKQSHGNPNSLLSWEKNIPSRASAPEETVLIFRRAYW